MLKVHEVIPAPCTKGASPADQPASQPPVCFIHLSTHLSITISLCIQQTGPSLGTDRGTNAGKRGEARSLQGQMGPLPSEPSALSWGCDRFVKLSLALRIDPGIPPPTQLGLSLRSGEAGRSQSFSSTSQEGRLPRQQRGFDTATEAWQVLRAKWDGASGVTELLPQLPLHVYKRNLWPEWRSDVIKASWSAKLPRGVPTPHGNGISSLAQTLPCDLTPGRIGVERASDDRGGGRRPSTSLAQWSQAQCYH